LSKLRQRVNNQTFAFRQARGVIKKRKPDLIITFLFHDTLNVGLASLLQIKRPKLFVGRRSPIGYGDQSRNFFHRLILRIIYKFSSLAISNSRANLESARHDGLTEQKIVYIDNFVENQGSQLKLNFSDETKLICVANFFEYKNHRNLIEALGVLNLQSQFQVTFVGEGPTRSEMIDLCSDLHLDAVFYTHDDQANLGVLKADFLLLPSFYEGSSNALLEGLSRGIPAIVTNVGHVPTLVEMGAPLLVSRGTDSKSLASALEDGFRSKSRLKKEAAGFKLIVEREFSEGKILKDWLNVIKSI
jgi:glycosyltransferase involved in cell wall biosynthesis